MERMAHKNAEIQIIKNHLFLQDMCIECRHYKAQMNETSATGMILCASFILRVSYICIIY